MEKAKGGFSRDELSMKTSSKGKFFFVGGSIKINHVDGKFQKMVVFVSGLS